MSTGGVAYNDTTIVPGGTKLISHLDMKGAKAGSGASDCWRLKYSRFANGDFCGADGLNNDITVATLTNANGGTPWGVDIAYSPGVAKGFLWEIVWGTTNNGTGGTSSPPPTTAGS